MKQIKFYLILHQNLLSKPDEPDQGVSRTHQTDDKVKNKMHIILQWPIKNSVTFVTLIKRP